MYYCIFCTMEIHLTDLYKVEWSLKSSIQPVEFVMRSTPTHPHTYTTHTHTRTSDGQVQSADSSRFALRHADVIRGGVVGTWPPSGFCQHADVEPVSMTTRGTTEPASVHTMTWSPAQYHSPCDESASLSRPCTRAICACRVV